MAKARTHSYLTLKRILSKSTTPQTSNGCHRPVRSLFECIKTVYVLFTQSILSHKIAHVSYQLLSVMIIYFII